MYRDACDFYITKNFTARLVTFFTDNYSCSGPGTAICCNLDHRVKKFKTEFLFDAVPRSCHA